MSFSTRLALVLSLPLLAFARGTVAEFTIAPSDQSTAPDPRQRTGLRIESEEPLLGQLDGFSLTPRFSVKFSGPVRLETLRAGIHFVWLESKLPGRFMLHEPGHRTPINEVVWNPFTNTAHGKPDEAFEGSRRYMIVVTANVLDAAGDPVEASGDFQQCVASATPGYCQELSAALSRHGGNQVVAASIFTTLSATAWLENARELQSKTVFQHQRGPLLAIASLREAVLQADVGTGSRREIPFPVPFSILAGSGVGRVAFGQLAMLNFLEPGGTLPDTPTTAEPPAATTLRAFHVWLPTTPPPPGGYPVILAGHGLGDSRFGIPTSFAIGMVNFGYAVVAMNAFGHGYGPETKLILRQADGTAVELPADGRGFDSNADGTIGESDGCILAPGGATVLIRDCLRQTAADWMHMARYVQTGLDLDGDGTTDLHRDRIYYIGQSLGAFYGTLAAAVEPAIQAAVLNAGGGSALPTFLYATNPLAFQIAPELPFRHQDVLVLKRPEAAAAQETFARWEWLDSVAAPASFAPHLKSATLPGVPIKRVLFQFAWGDRTVPNPASSHLVRAANMRESTSLYRHDWARAAANGLPENPHIYMAGLGNLAFSAVGFATQTQAVRFLESETEDVPDVNPFLRVFFRRDVFETPEFLPEALNF